MKRMFGFFACCMVLFLIGGVVIIFAENSEDDFMSVPMGNITLEPPEAVEAKRSDVVFPHAQHFDNSCQVCHHKWKKQTPLQNCTTADCHNLAINPKKKQKRKVDEALAIKYYKKAYHDQCIGCHKTRKAENKKKEFANVILTELLPNVGPSRCVDCHPKE